MKKMLILLFTIFSAVSFSENVDIVIKNATVLTMDSKRTVIENGVVAIKNNAIVEVGNEELLSKYKGKKTIDAENDIVMPGFINTHTHVSMVAFRSLADDVPDRLSRYIFPLENKLVSRDLVYKGAVYGILEMVSTGTTTFADMYYFEDEVAKAAELIGVALIVGLARAVNIIMDNGFISDTLLYYSSQLVANMSHTVFALFQFGIFSVLGFFIQSSSGLAVLSMPIMAPLADTAGVSREIIINAYNWGQGLMSFITPTGMILVFLEMAEVTFDKWLKFVLPLFGMIAAFSAAMLVINTMM